MAPPTQTSNGLLPAPTVLQKQNAASNSASRGPASRKNTGPRLKVVIRRLPPGLTQSEFETDLGEEWKLGAGKLNWFDYRVGKISKDSSKPSRPSRAYLHLTDQAHLKTLSERVQECTFTDAKNTSRDLVLIGPPALEFAPYTRVPIGKRRTDARQGTIDQDPEFIEYLQSLTNPITKSTGLDAEDSSKKETVKTTPLIEHLRDKKAAKEKASAKGAKHGKQEAKEAKVEKGNKKAVKGPADVPEKGKKPSKTEKAAKEAVKVLNKQASVAATGQPAEKNAPASANGAAERRRERPVRPINIAAKIQQDLGLAPGGRRGKRDSALENQHTLSRTTSQESATAGSAASKDPIKKGTKTRRPSKSGAAEKPSLEAAVESAKAVPTGPSQPTILKKIAVKGTPAPAPPKGVKTQTPPATAPNSKAHPLTDPSTLPRHAFLKHANPSQGITEPLIEEAMKAFGDIEKVEIDRKKGFAYVDFADNAGLKKAIAASPIKIAQGAVQVLEKRDRMAARAAPVAPMQMQRGGFRGGRIGRGIRGGGRGGIAGPVGGNSSTATTDATASTATASPGPELAGSTT